MGFEILPSATVARFKSDFMRTPFEVDRVLYIIVLSSFLVCRIVFWISHWYLKTTKHYPKLALVDRIEWQTRVVSSMHSCIVFPICLWVVLTDNELAANPLFGRSWPVYYCFSIGIGYFGSDFIQVVYYGIPPVVPLVCHHVFASWGFFVAMSNIGGGAWFGAALLLTEAANPFSNVWWMLEKAGRKDTRAYAIIGYCFALSWLVFRVLINPYIIWKLYMFWDDAMAMSPYLKFLLALNMTFLIAMNNVYFVTGPFFGILFGSNNAKVTSASKSSSSNAGSGTNREKFSKKQK